MRADEFPEQLCQALLPAISECASKLAAEPMGQVYAFCIYCASGCQSITIAAQTLTALAEQNAKAEGDTRQTLVNTVGAMEWEHAFVDPRLFSQADSLVDSFYDTLYDGEFEDVSFDDDVSSAQLQDFAYDRFMPAFVEAIRRSRQSGVFAAKAFANDVLLGVQFADPYGGNWDLMENASASVNSPEWHRQFKAYCDLGRG